MIHVCYGLYDKDGHYSKFVGVSMASIFENTREDVTVHILCDNTLSVDNRDKFVYLAGRYGQQVKFYNLEEVAAEKISYIKDSIPKIASTRYTMGALYRLLVPVVLDSTINKAIYFDSDIFATLDIAELWEVNISDKPLAAVSEASMGLSFEGINVYLLHAHLVEYKNYFNSGVLFFNLEYIRNNYSKLQNGFKFVAKLINEDKHVSWDQDILNYCFSDNYVKLPVNFNKFVTWARHSNKIVPALYHYVMNSIGIDMNDMFNRLYFKHFAKTPWFNIDMFNGVSQAVNELQNQSKISLINLTKIMAGKTRAFFVEPQNVEVIKQLFAVSPDEEIITPPPTHSLEALVKAMRRSQGKKITFIFVNDYRGVCNILLQNNFVEGSDFIDGTMLLPIQQNNPASSYSIIRAM